MGIYELPSWFSSPLESSSIDLLSEQLTFLSQAWLFCEHHPGGTCLVTRQILLIFKQCSCACCGVFGGTTAVLSLGIRWEISADAGLFYCHFHPHLTEYRETLLHCVCLFIFQSPQFLDRDNEIPLFFLNLFIYFIFQWRWDMFDRDSVLHSSLDGFVYISPSITGMHD